MPHPGVRTSKKDDGRDRNIIMDSKIFQIPAEMIKAETKRNKSIRLIFDSQENISAEELKRLFEWRDNLGWLTFSIRTIEIDDLKELPELKTDNKKTPSQRMRAIIYRIWEKDNHSYEDFNLFYLWYMEKIIEKLKDKL